MKRYDSTPGGMDRHKHGDYCYYDDVEKLQWKAERLMEALEDIHTTANMVKCELAFPCELLEMIEMYHKEQT